jgi:hypothetical protein
MDLEQIKCDCADWILLTLNRHQKASFCGHSNKYLGSIKGEKFLDQLSSYNIRKKDSAPWSWPVALQNAHSFIHAEHHLPLHTPNSKKENFRIHRYYLQ